MDERTPCRPSPYVDEHAPGSPCPGCRDTFCSHRPPSRGNRAAGGQTIEKCHQKYLKYEILEKEGYLYSNPT